MNDRNPFFTDNPMFPFIVDALEKHQRVLLQLAGCGDDEETIRVDALIEVGRAADRSLWFTVRTPCGNALIAARHVAAVFTAERQEVVA